MDGPHAHGMGRASLQLHRTAPDLFIFDIRGPVIKRNNDPDIPVKRSRGDNDSGECTSHILRAHQKLMSSGHTRR